MKKQRLYLTATPNSTGSPNKKLERQNRQAIFWIVFLFIFLFVSISALAVGFYLSQIQKLTTDKHNELTTILDSKIAAVSSWRDERLGNAAAIQKDPLISQSVNDLIHNPTDQALRQQNLGWLTTRQTAYGYSTFLLLDSDGRVLIRDPYYFVEIAPETRALIQQALSQNQIIFSDLYQVAGSPTIYMDLLVPILDPAGPNEKPIALCLLRVDPLVSFYPMIQTWPVPSQSGEMVLFRLDGEQITYLNALRFKADSALRLHYPLDTPNLPAAKIALGETGVVEGIDYRGAKVLFAGKPVPGSNWFLLAKIDRSEVFAELRRDGWILGVVLGLVLLSDLSLAFVLINRQRRLYTTELMESERDRQEASQRFNQILEGANDIVLIFDSEGRVTDFNDRAIEAYGYDRQKLMGMQIMAFRSPEFREPTHEYLEKVKTTGSLRFETIHSRKDGSTFSADASIRYFKVNDAGYFLDIIRDISDRKAAQKELETSEARYRGMIEHASDGIFTADENGRFVSVNDVACKMLGYPRKVILQKQVFDLISSTSLKAEPTHFGEIANGTRSYVVTEREVIRKDGSLLPVEISGFKLPDGKVQGIVRDISERVRHRNELEKALERYRQFFEMNPISTYVFDIESEKILDVNEAAAEFYGYSKKEFIGLTVNEIHIEQADDSPMRGAEDEKQNASIHRHKKKDGNEVYVEVNSHDIDFDGKPARIVLEIDITEKLRAEEVLKENLNNLQSIIDTSPLATITLNKKGLTTQWNKAAEQIFGWKAEEVLGRQPQIFLDSEGDDLDTVLKRIFSSDRPITYEGVRRRKDGRKINVRVSASTIRDYRDEVKGVLGLIADITDAKLDEAAQKALAEERDSLLNRLQLQFKNIPVGFLLTDANLNILDWNPQAEKIFGYSREEVIGKSEFGTIIPEDQAQAVKYVVKRSIMHNQTIVSTNENMTKEGRRIMVEWRNNPLWDESGKLIALMDMAVDVTEKMEAEKKLRESEEKLRALFDSSLIGIIFADINGLIYTANDVYLDIIGYSRDDLEAGKILWNEITPPEYLKVDELAIAEAKAKGVCAPYEKQYIRKNGEIVWVLIGFVLVGEKKEQSIAFVLDITERKKFEQALKESEIRYGELFKNMINGMAYSKMIYDEDGNAIDYINLKVNEAFEQLTGLKDIEGKRITEVIPNIREDNPDLFEVYGRVANTGKPESFETYVPGLGIYYSIHVYSPEKGYFTVIFEDISDRKKAEAEINALNEGLEQRVRDRTSELQLANQELEAFTYSVSHDLRAPIRAIDGFSQIVIDEHGEEIGPDITRYLQIIRKNTRNMGQLVDDLLAFSRLGKQPVQRGQVDLNVLVKSVVADTKQLNPNRNIDFKVKKMKPCSADESLLRQVFVNLISNAVKFTRQKDPAVIEIGEVLAKPRLQDGSYGNEVLCYHVKDNGVGFDMRFYDKLFGVFQRLHNIEDYEGTGVGLAIIKRVVEKHGGIVWAESVLNSGTTFFFTLGKEEQNDQPD
jgi:PAS domain S-box-containing protein